MAVSEDVLVRLRAIGQAAFESAMTGAAHSITDVGTAAERTTKQTDSASASAKRSAPAWRRAAGGLAKMAGGAAALYAAKRGLESAVHTTEELAKGTMRLQRTTGMDAEQASAWAEITKVRGVNTAQFQRGLVSLSKQMESARHGTKASVSMFKDLGVSMDAIKAGDTQTVMLQMADGMKALKNPATKASYAQKLLARQGQELLPLFNSGSAAIQEQLDTAKRYGAVIGGEGVANTKEFAQRQRELKMASDGLKVSIGEALVPVMLSLSQIVGKVVAVAQPFLRNTTALQIAVVALTAAFVVYKVATIAATIATLGLNAAWLLIPLAIIAVGAAFVYAYKKVGWFRDAVDAVVGFIRSHWRLLAAILVGPFAIAVLVIARNIGKIKALIRAIPGAFRAAFASVKGIADAAIHWVAERFRQLGDLISRVADKVRHAPKALLDKVNPFAAGGVTRAGTVSLVGERGPELLQLPGGSRITPLSSPALSVPSPVLSGVATTAHFYLDRRLVGTAVARDTADRKARR